MYSPSMDSPSLNSHLKLPFTYCSFVSLSLCLSFCLSLFLSLSPDARGPLLYLPPRHHLIDPDLYAADLKGDVIGVLITAKEGELIVFRNGD